DHLVDPLATLEWARGLLAEGGRAIVSLPNVAHWSVRWSLLVGRFDYADYGLLDRTHLRFFTQRSAHRLAADAGFQVVRERYTPALLPGEVTAKRLQAMLARTPGSGAVDAAGPAAAAPPPRRRIPGWASRANVARV